MNNRKQIALSVILVLGAGSAVGFYSAWGSPAVQEDGMAGHNHAAMGGGGDDQLNSITLTEEAGRSIGVRFARVEWRPLNRSVRTVGTVGFDERRRATLNPKFEGWVEHLYVDFTGAPVRKGQPLLEVYSPMLVTAQEELILARRLADEATGERAAANATSLLESARRRLAYWDISPAEIARIEETGQPKRTLALRSPASGVVVAKNVVEGGRIMPGMDIFEIADLSGVWVEGEVFEKDLALATEGQAAAVTFQSYPGEVFDGTVAYVYPTVSADSRTGRIRVELDNPGLRLRPGMYADIRLAGTGAREGLAVPRSAVLFTGERAIVFVRHGETLMPHEVTTGFAAGDFIEILSGVNEGMEVVASASFLIDAESNLGASMGGMADMDHSSHDMGADMAPPAPQPMDHSGHEGMDHSGHEPADHSGHEGTDHSGHEGMDHSGHE